LNDQRTNPPAPPLGEIERVARAYAGKVPSTKPPKILGADTPEKVYDIFVEVMNSGAINPQASPGWPLSLYGKEVKDVVNARGLRHVCLLATAKYMLLDAISLAELEVLPALERVALGVTGVKRLFVKNEPHTLAKLADKRERVIWNLDFIDQLIERAMLSEQYAAEKAEFYRIPAINGMSNTDEGIEVVAQRIKLIRDPVSSDMSGYDYRVSAWAHRVEALRLCYSMQMDTYDNTVTKIYDNLSTSVAMTPSGSLYTQIAKGGTRSGSLTTSQGGSATRIQYSMFVFGDECEGGFAHGDDCIEPSRGVSKEEFVARHNKFGLKVKCLQTAKELEFCGLHRSGNPAFLNVYKTLHNFFQEVERDHNKLERMTTLWDELRHHPDLPAIKDFVQRVLDRPKVDESQSNSE